MPTFDTDEASIHYTIEGTGLPLLLIGGLGSTVDSWAEQIGVYARSFRCVRYDARGAGSSTNTKDSLTVRLLASDALQLLDYLEVESCHVIGTSLGAATALELGLMDPIRIQRLVLHAPWDQTAAYPHLKRQFECRLDLLKRGAFDVFETLTSLFTLSPEFLNASLGASGVTEQSDERRGNDLSHDGAKVQALIRLIGAILDHDVRGRIGGIASPTLVTVGQDDFIVRPEYAAAVANAIPGARLTVWEQTGHLARIERPHLFIEKTLEFLSG